MSQDVYRYPEYYDLAFSFVKVAEQVEELFLPLIRQYSTLAVHRVLDVCCGPAPQLREFARRGYEAVGLDLSPQMLDHLRRQAEAEHLSLETVQGDMLDFTLATPADFAYILMGSLTYVASTEGMVRHLQAMAKALRPGALYLIENIYTDWTYPRLWKPQSWEMSADGVTVKSTYRIRLCDPARQRARTTLVLDVDDRGAHRHIANDEELKLFFPDEFRTIVELQGAFEFVGYFNRYLPEPLEGISPDHVALLRRRGEG